jgi:hypothetical protein
LGESCGGSGNYDQMERLMKAQVAKAARLGYRLGLVGSCIYLRIINDFAFVK